QGVNNLVSNAVSNAQGPIAGNASGTTRSAISAGTVVITDNAGQLAKTGKDADATIAGLNRDTAHANDGAIGKIFDKEKVEERQEIARLQAQVVQQVAPLLYKQVGNFLEKQPTEVRVAVHALVGGLISRAMGGEFAAGAIGAGAATLAVETFGKQLLAIDGLSEGDRKALVQLVGMAVSGVAAGAAGGSSAGVAAATGTAQLAVQNNFLTHQQRDQRAEELASCKSARECDAVSAKWDAISKKQQADAQACISSDSCKVVLNALVWPSIESALNEAKAECAPPRMCSAQAQEDINQLQRLWNQKDAIQSFYEVEKFVAEFVAVGRGVTVAIGAVSKAVEIARGLRVADEAATLTAGAGETPVLKNISGPYSPVAGDGTPITAVRVGSGYSAGDVLPVSPAVSSGETVNITGPITSNGAANVVTSRQLAVDLAIAQSKDPLIGTTLPGAAAPVQVTADASIGGRSFFDVNQTARATGSTSANKPTLIADLVEPGSPNGTYGTAHAEIGTIQQAYDAGLTKNESMTIIVRGQAPCDYCQSHLIKMANAAGLNQLTVVNGVDGSVIQWVRGSFSWNVIKRSQFMGGSR
ncbi:VENN motif pre-toxin domain-containing protein, partial [Ralstonia solanacearum]